MLKSVIPAFWEAKAGRSPEVRGLRPAWQHGETPSLLKYKNEPGVVLGAEFPATQEAEAEESLEPERQRL